jgi:ATP-dependent Lon protease
MVTNYNGEEMQIKDNLPIIPIRDLVVYPFMILPLFVGRSSSIKSVEESFENFDRFVLLTSQKDVTTENPGAEDIYEVGTVAMIMRMRKLPDGRVKILVQGIKKAKIENFIKLSPYLHAQISLVEEDTQASNDPLVSLKINHVKDLLEKYISFGRELSPDLIPISKDIVDPGRLVDLIASNLTLKVSEKQKLLETFDPLARLNKVNAILSRELEKQKKLSSKKGAFFDDSSTPRDYNFRDPLKNIRSDFKDINNDLPEDEFAELRQKLFQAKIPFESERETLKQIQRLEKMHPESSESSILKNYLDWVVELPWSISSKDDLDLHHAKLILDEDHFDLEKVKQRILEFLAVKQLKGKKMKGPILCFSGPPGVGKTSLGKSIARATNRKFARISLGGIKDEAEIRGHRRTYVGSMPGRIIQALKQVKTNNPIILLDEVDKLGGDFRGDPSSALLEVLDSEQNDTFRDNFINLPFDLSNILFIATANILEDIPVPLRDRMEVLTLTGYTEEEKIKIAQKYLIKRQLEENGIPHELVTIPPESLSIIIRYFNSEAGLRGLERKIGAISRKMAIKMANGTIEKTVISKEMVSEFLGPRIYTENLKNEKNEIGVCTGLAWTATGGQIFAVESTKIKGKGVTLTGQLGDVMKESAQTALGHIKSNASKFCIDEKDFELYEIHIHLPAGAIPKDGPSAGITLATTIVSLFTNCPVNREIAMTGEITLTGRVLAIGGLKEKCLAAMRAGIHTIIIPWENQKDLVDIPKEYLQKITFIPVKRFSEVINIALVNWQKRKRNWKKNKKLENDERLVA